MRKKDLTTLAIWVAGLVAESRDRGHWRPVPTKEIDQAWEAMATEVLAHRSAKVAEIFQHLNWKVKVEYFGGMLSRQAFEELYLEALRRHRERQRAD